MPQSFDTLLHVKESFPKTSKMVLCGDVNPLRSRADSNVMSRTMKEVSDECAAGGFV